jgi:hypothetical protein
VAIMGQAIEIAVALWIAWVLWHLFADDDI